MRLDGDDAFVHGGRRIGARGGGAHELCGGPVDDDGHMAHRRLHAVPAGARREVAHELERVEASLVRLLDGQADKRRLRIRVRRSRFSSLRFARIFFSEADALLALGLMMYFSIC